MVDPGDRGVPWDGYRTREPGGAGEHRMTFGADRRYDRRCALVPLADSTTPDLAGTVRPRPDARKRQPVYEDPPHGHDRREAWFSTPVEFGARRARKPGRRCPGSGHQRIFPSSPGERDARDDRRRARHRLRGRRRDVGLTGTHARHARARRARRFGIGASGHPQAEQVHGRPDQGHAGRRRDRP